MAYQRASGDTSGSITDSSREAISDPSATLNSTRTNNAYVVRDTPQSSAASGQSARKRKHSKAKAGKSSSRTMAAPQMRGTSIADADVDKSRNKLGYQRISIACAHCRRRKIRCLIDENDPQQRCQNCIRLKKECLFYPVEQQSVMEERSQSSSKGGPSSTVSSSPREIGSARSFDDVESHDQFPPFASPIPEDYPGMPLGIGRATYNQGPLPPNEFEQHEAGENRSPWIHPNEFDTHTHAARNPALAYPNQHYLHLNPYESTGDFAPFPLDSLHESNQQHAPTIAYAPHRGEPAWQQPLRSMSYGHVANSDVNYGGGYHMSTVAPGLSPLEMHDVSTAGQKAGSLYTPGGQHENPYSPYHYSMVARSVYSDNWYSDPRAYGPAQGQETETPFEEGTEHQ